MSAGIVISLPECEKGIGDVILKPDSPKLIDGVRCAPIALWPDDRGYFFEVQRAGLGLNSHFPIETTQISAALNYPGIIKAFHYHRHQTNCWKTSAKSPVICPVICQLPLIISLSA